MLDRIVNFFLVNAAIVLPLAVIVALLVSSTARAMVMGLLRILARPLLLLAVVALVYDGTRTLAGGSGLVITSLGEHWTNLWPSGLEAFKSVATAKLGAGAWAIFAGRVLRLPAWLVAGVLGLALSWLGRRRRKVGIFVN